MNAKLKKRLLVVTGAIVIVVVVVLAIVAGTTGAASITVADAASGDYNGKKVQVTGKVVNNSFTYDDASFSFTIYPAPAEGEEEVSAAGVAQDVSGRPTLKVTYDKQITASFGNGIEATCVGVINSEGVLECSELTTKCPSKYESSQDALTVDQVVSYGESFAGTHVKLTGKVKAGSLKPIGQDVRLVVYDPDGEKELSVQFADANKAIPDSVKDDVEVVLEGAMDKDGNFIADEINLRG